MSNISCLAPRRAGNSRIVGSQGRAGNGKSLFLLHPRPVNQLELLLLCLAGWINRNQRQVIEYLQEEVRVLKEGEGLASTMSNVAA